MPNLEWSGILFYKIVEGDIETASELKLEAVEIWPMAKGGTATVSFDYEDEWTDVFELRPELEDISKGVVHSHNNMGVFHSGTDMNDLSTNCGHYNFYVSLVTNNKLEFDCKIAVPGNRTVKRSTASESLISFRNSFGRMVNKPFKDNKKEEVAEEIMILFEVEVTRGEYTPIVDELFSERVDEIMKPKSVIATHTGVWDGNRSIYGGSYRESWSPTYPSRGQQELFNRDDYYRPAAMTAFSAKEDENDKDDLDVMFDPIRTIISDTLYICYKDVKLTEIDTELFNYFNLPRTAREVDKDSQTFLSTFFKMMYSDLTTDYETKEERDKEAVNLVDTFIDYLTFFESNDFIISVLSDLESHLKLQTV